MKRNGVPLDRPSLVRRCVTDTSLLEFVCELNIKQAKARGATRKGKRCECYCRCCGLYGSRCSVVYFSDAGLELMDCRLTSRNETKRNETKRFTISKFYDVYAAKRAVAAAGTPAPSGAHRITAFYAVLAIEVVARPGPLPEAVVQALLPYVRDGLRCGQERGSRTHNAASAEQQLAAYMILTQLSRRAAISAPLLEELLELAARYASPATAQQVSALALS